MTPMSTLRLVLGDQLNDSISCLEGCDKARDIIFMCEVADEASYVPHHQKKMVFLFSAMRHFAEYLKQQGFSVDYVTLQDAENTGSFSGELSRAVKRHHCDQVITTFPGEYRVLMMMQSWQSELNIPVEIRPDNRFLCSLERFQDWAKGRKQLRMEYFYREMRQDYQILMQGNQPEGGAWNFDQDNRKPPNTNLDRPKPFMAQPDTITRDVIELIETQFQHHFGDIAPFFFAVTRDDALKSLDLFIKERLVYFGDYQDAMIENDPWMFHSHLSMYLNCGLLLPLECIQAAEEAYKQGSASLSSVEGFIRQILGWREFVRGIYWLKMPDYADVNFLYAKRKLPDFYWTGNTRMNCVKECITDTKKFAYANHIQRLMVLGNFALLTGLDPKLVNEWYLLVYADAYEWVELPNVSGMVLFADGGYLASKPYAAGGNYIKKMSNYCDSCDYKVAKKTGPDACPFNYLYWNFLMSNREKLEKNPRVSMMYRTLDKMSRDKVEEIQDNSKAFLNNLSAVSN